MLQITRTGLVLTDKLELLRDLFAARHYIVLKNLLEPTLLATIQRGIEQAQWDDSTFDDGFFGTEFTLKNPGTLQLLNFLLNKKEFLTTINAITGDPEISDFRGRVYRMMAGAQHQLSWHNDINEEQQRRVGFSMNLSTAVFRGGTFELRTASTLAPLAAVNNTGFGDALLFRISADLEHRVTAVVDSIPKTACAGWFCATGKNFFAELLQESKRPLEGS